MQRYIGTSGYAYPAWKGSFYPAGLKNKQMLPYYAGQFATVELNNSFYRLPTAEQFAAWASEVPASFRFAVKAPQQITHRLRLANAAEPVAELWRGLTALGDKQGPVLFQLPPFQKKDVGLLRAFLAQLPRPEQSTFEFRHESWFDDAVFQALGDGGAALCIADAEKLTTPLQATTDWGYLRLRREDYRKKDIAAWGERIAAQKWQRAFIYFKHEDTGIGPKFARWLMATM